MKKVFIPITLVFLILCSSFVQAADTVVVIPLGGTNVYIDPRNIVDAYGQVSSSGFTTVTLLTVPSDKHFVLTDIVGQASSSIRFFENKTRKLTLSYLGSQGYTNSVTISSGIVFAPDSQVTIKGEDAIITISGYYY